MSGRMAKSSQKNRDEFSITCVRHLFKVVPQLIEELKKRKVRRFDSHHEGHELGRVKQGGHNVPRRDVLRRFNRSWFNFINHYRLFADTWSVHDNSGAKPRLLEEGP
jgi:hypothetical protein